MVLSQFILLERICNMPLTNHQLAKVLPFERVGKLTHCRYYLSVWGNLLPVLLERVGKWLTASIGELEHCCMGERGCCILLGWIILAKGSSWIRVKPFGIQLWIIGLQKFWFQVARLYFSPRKCIKIYKNWVFNKNFTWLFDISGSQDCADPVL